MNPEIKPQNPSGNHKGLEMYFSSEIAEKFAEHEQNEKNFKVARIVDAILIQETADLKPRFILRSWAAARTLIDMTDFSANC